MKRTLLAALFLASTAQAQMASLIRADALRTEPYADSGKVADAPKGAQVRIVERKGTWVRVALGAQSGWLRGLALKADDQGAVRPEGVLALQTGREARGGVAIALAVRSPRAPGPGLALLENLFTGRDPARTVNLRSGGGNADPLELALTSDRPGFAYVFMTRQTAGAVHCVYPAAPDPDNALAAGIARRIPIGSSPGAAAAGAPTYVALVFDQPLDLVLPDKEAEGPYFRFPVTADNAELIAAALRSGCAGDRCYGAAAISPGGRK